MWPSDTVLFSIARVCFFVYRDTCKHHENGPTLQLHILYYRHVPCRNLHSSILKNTNFVLFRSLPARSRGRSQMAS